MLSRLIVWSLKCSTNFTEQSYLCNFHCFENWFGFHASHSAWKKKSVFCLTKFFHHIVKNHFIYSVFKLSTQPQLYRIFENAMKVVGNVSMNRKKVNTHLQKFQLLLKASSYKSPRATVLETETHTERRPRSKGRKPFQEVFSPMK